MRSTPIGGRPFPGFGYTGSMRAHSSRHGTTRSISARNCARRVVFVYFSKPVPTSVSCERLFISTSRSHVMWLAASQHNTRESGSLLQRFLRLCLTNVTRSHFKTRLSTSKATGEIKETAVGREQVVRAHGEPAEVAESHE